MNFDLYCIFFLTKHHTELALDTSFTIFPYARVVEHSCVKILFQDMIH